MTSRTNVWSHFKTNVKRLDRMSQRARGNEIHAGIRDFAGRFYSDTTGSFGYRSAGAHPDTLTHLFERHVIEQDQLSKSASNET